MSAKCQFEYVSFTHRPTVPAFRQFKEYGVTEAFV